MSIEFANTTLRRTTISGRCSQRGQNKKKAEGGKEIYASLPFPAVFLVLKRRRGGGESKKKLTLGVFVFDCCVPGTYIHTMHTYKEVRKGGVRSTNIYTHTPKQCTSISFSLRGKPTAKGESLQRHYCCNEPRRAAKAAKAGGGRFFCRSGVIPRGRAEGCNICRNSTALDYSGAKVRNEGSR